MIFMNFVDGLQKLNSIQNDDFLCPGATGTLPKWFWINLGWLTFYHFSSKICPQKIVFEYREHQFYANSGGFETRILKFMIFSSAVFKGFKLTDIFLKFDQGCQSWDLFIIFKYDEISSMWGITLWAGYLLYESFKEDKWTI